MDLSDRRTCGHQRGRGRSGRGEHLSCTGSADCLREHRLPDEPESCIIRRGLQCVGHRRVCAAREERVALRVPVQRE